MIGHINNTVQIIFCHLVGDYVLQTDFIAKSKKENFYHMTVHCMLYVLPFYVVFGFTWKLIVLFFSHMVIDIMKVKYRVIEYMMDQILHYIIALMLYTI